MPKQGVASSFTFGDGYGQLKMGLTAVGIPFELVTPQAWQKGLAIPPRKKSETRTKWKHRLREVAHRLYPNAEADINLKTADAILIATYCYRKHNGCL